MGTLGYYGARIAESCKTENVTLSARWINIVTEENLLILHSKGTAWTTTRTTQSTCTSGWREAEVEQASSSTTSAILTVPLTAPHRLGIMCWPSSPASQHPSISFASKLLHSRCPRGTVCLLQEVFCTATTTSEEPGGRCYQTRTSRRQNWKRVENSSHSKSNRSHFLRWR